MNIDFITLKKMQQKFDEAMKVYEAAALTGRETMERVRDRINEAKALDVERISELERVCFNLPSEELRRLNAQVETTERPRDTDFWVNYYRHSSGGGLTNQESAKAKDRIRELEGEIRLTPATPEEIELAGLRRKKYEPTQEETAELQENLFRLEEALRKLNGTETHLRREIEDIKNAVDQIDGSVVDCAKAAREQVINLSTKIHRLIG